MTAAEEYWWLGPLISICGLIITLAVIIWFNWGQHKVRVLRSRRPFNAYLAHDANKPDEYWELHVPSNSEVMIQIRMRPRISYQQTEIVFGFFGNTAERPVTKRVLNTFIKVGMNREPSPNNNPHYYIDQDDHYHITTQVERVPPHTYVLGFIVQTREPGRYPVMLSVITDCGEATPHNDLDVIVE